MQTSATEHRRWANQPIVREVDRDRARWMWAMLAAFLLASAPFGAYLLQQNACLSLSIRASELRAELRLLEQQRHRLSMEYSRESALHNIEPWALDVHGMTKPSADRVFVLGAATRKSSQAP